MNTGKILDFSTYKAIKEGSTAQQPLVWEWNSEPIEAVTPAVTVKPKVQIRAKRFDFDSDEAIPAEAPYTDYTELQNWLLKNLLAILIILVGVKLMWWIVSTAGGIFIVKLLRLLVPWLVNWKFLPHI
ncbi:hypothetical protein [Paenibacillus thermotolerans]|uniref:hypothetical protein n=1 Tax=Paenibacillus thermotolerans TaxID=3027807 RepID=UPI0023683B59|nr:MULTISPECIES: hypothetical protein [unclassified Paenibacillus]